MNTYRKNAVIVGAMYIIATIGGILSLVLTEPARTSQDLLTYISANENQIVLGAISVLIMGLALAMVPSLASQQPASNHLCQQGNTLLPLPEILALLPFFVAL